MRAALAIALGGGGLRPRAASAPPSATHAQANAAMGQSLDEAAILGPPRAAPLAGAELDAATRALGERMRCPVCQGMSIADSPSASALAMMAQVRDLLARGYTERAGARLLRAQLRRVRAARADRAGLQPGGVAAAARRGGDRSGPHRAAAARARARGGTTPAKTAAASRAPAARAGDPDLDRYVERVRSEVGS